MSNLQKSLLQNKLPPIAPSSGGRRGSGSGLRRRHDYSPVSWSAYWDKCTDVKTDDGGIFRVYHKGDTGPLLLLLHGGGYSALTWSLFVESISEMVECQVMAYDQRGHGNTNTNEDLNLSAETLANDVRRVMEAVFGSSYPSCVLVGHSMGGAVAVHAAHDLHIAGLLGLIVIDVVEGTAMDALTSMQTFLRGRPQNFNSLQNAIEWGVRSGQTRNVDAAKVSMPGQVKNLESGECGTSDIDHNPPLPHSTASTASSPISAASTSTLRAADSIPEEDEEDSAFNTASTSTSTSGSSSHKEFIPPLPVRRVIIDVL